MKRAYRCFLAVTAAVLLPLAVEAQVTLEYWQYFAGGGAREQALAEAFLEKFHARNPDIRVSFRAMSGSEITDAFYVASAAGIAPDVIAVPPLDYIDWVNNGMLLDLTPYMERESKMNLDFWLPFELRRSLVDGKMYQVPIEFEWLVMYYNTTIFAEAGLAPPPSSLAEAWSWDEFLEAGRTLTVIDASGEVVRPGFAAAVSAVYRMEPLARMFGGKIYDYDAGRYTLTSEGTLAAINAIHEMIYERSIMRPGGEGAGGSWWLADDRVAMVIDPQTYADRWILERDFADFGLAAFPKGPAGAFTKVTAFSLAVSAQSRHPQAAWRLVRARVLDEMGLYDDDIVPDRQSLGYQVTYKYGDTPFYENMLEVALEFVEPGAVPWRVHAGIRETLGPVQSALAEIFTGRAGTHILSEVERSVNARIEELEK